jgi:hypothetical protein
MQNYIDSVAKNTDTTSSDIGLLFVGENFQLSKIPALHITLESLNLCIWSFN